MTAASVTVTRFRIAGNQLLTAEQLAPSTAGFLNRPLTFAQLQEAAAAVAAAYRQSGWIVSVYLPRQEIDGGVVTLQVIEARFGTAVHEGPAPQRLHPDRALAMVAAAQPAGQPVNGDAIDRALLLLGDLPGITASGNLRAGQQDGQTDLVLNLADKPLLSGDAGIDNTGSRATGPERLAANASLNSPLRGGDLWTANLLYSQGVRYLRVAASLPLGHGGWRLGASASGLNYKVVSPDFAALGIHGSSSTAGLDAQYPLVRTRLLNLYLAANLDRKSFDNHAGGVTSTRYRIHVASLGLAGNLLDTWGGGGASNATLGITRGKLDLNGSPNQAADAATTRAAGGFTRIRYSLSRQQVITGNLSASLLLTGQAASKNLDSAEKFYLGGASGVRAYPTSEAGGAAGQMLNLELLTRLPSQFSLIGFYDWGQVTTNINNSFAGAAAPNRHALKGAGLSLAWAGPQGIYLKATWARRLGGNPNPTATGRDQDGSLTHNRFWLMASLAF